jgi:ATP-dependent Clp protease adaptor protein ClpS
MRVGASGLVCSRSGLDVGGLLAFWSGNHFERNALPLFERAEAIHLNRGKMGEHVVRTIVWFNETKPFCVVKPLNGSCRHIHNLPAFRNRRVSSSLRLLAAPSGAGFKSSRICLIENPSSTAVDIVASSLAAQGIHVVRCKSDIATLKAAMPHHKWLAYRMLLKSENRARNSSIEMLMSSSSPSSPPPTAPPTPQRVDEGSVAIAERVDTKPPPMYRVLLVNDDYTPMDFVVGVLQTVFAMTRQQATNVMLQVHRTGMGTCGVYTKEIADTKVRQVLEIAQEHQHPLQCTMEPN